MRRAVRAIIVRDDQLLVMHRNKFGTEYDTLPGGGVELQETAEEALIREVAEETSISFSDFRLIAIEQAGEPYGTQYIYWCKYLSGEPKLQADSEEAYINRLGQNLYDPQWVYVAELIDKPFKSANLKKFILRCLREGFPQKPQQI